MYNEYQTPDPRQERLQARLARLERSVQIDTAGIAAAGYVQPDSSYFGLMKIGDLMEFDPHDPQNYPKFGGIYVLYDIWERPLYVGQGDSIGTRLRYHIDKFWFKSPLVESGSYVMIDDKTLRERVEAVLIKFLKGNAVINKRFVDR